MKLLVISDTHGEMPLDMKKIDFDAVIHAGDIGNAAFFGNLDSETGDRNFYAVCGNTDFILTGCIPESISAEIGGTKFFIVHNLAAPHRISPANERAITAAHAEIVVFGHTHTPAVEERDGIIFLNPGSLGKIGLTGCRSFAFLEIKEAANVSAKIYDVDSKKVIISKKFNKIDNLFKEV